MAKQTVGVRAKRQSIPKRMKTTEDRIAERREVMQVEPVSGTVPTWFIQRLKKKYPEPKSAGLANRRVLDETLKRYGLGDDWVDHIGSSKMPDGRACFVAEPYLELYDFDDLRRKIDQFETLCKSLGLESAIMADSWHYPGRTIRLAAAEPA